MELIDIVGKVIELCTIEGDQNESVRKLKLTLEVLQKNSDKIVDADISKNLQDQIKEELLEAEQLITSVIKSK